MSYIDIGLIQTVARGCILESLIVEACAKKIVMLKVIIHSSVKRYFLICFISLNFKKRNSYCSKDYIRHPNIRDSFNRAIKLLEIFIPRIKARLSFDKEFYIG